MPRDTLGHFGSMKTVGFKETKLSLWKQPKLGAAGVFEDVWSHLKFELSQIRWL